jgi:hypothetical protein
MVKLYNNDDGNLKQLKDAQTCRDIIKKINDFGVSQLQIINLIYLLALELEDVTITKRIVKTISKDRLTLTSNDKSESFIITN